MKNRKTFTKGFADPLTLGLIALILIVLALFAYFSLYRGAGKQTTDTGRETAPQEAMPTISDLDEIDVMEEELETIDIGNPESDLNSLDSEASSL